jgi:hypothetical protein
MDTDVGDVAARANEVRGRASRSKATSAGISESSAWRDRAAAIVYAYDTGIVAPR